MGEVPRQIILVLPVIFYYNMVSGGVYLFEFSINHVHFILYSSFVMIVFLFQVVWTLLV